MHPIGLTLKTTRNKYAPCPAGEVMVVHRCTVCGAFSVNRIAADDGVNPLMDVFRSSLALPDQIRNTLCDLGICLLERADADIVSHRLFGSLQPARIGRFSAGE
jgi:hypothetical protein